MRKIIIVGAYGCGNKGDDAILEGILSILKQKYDIYATCGQYGGIAEQFHIKTIKCRMNEGMKITVLCNLLLFFPQIFIKLFFADALLIGGGSLIHDLTKYNLPFFAILQQMARFLGKKVFYIGVGVGKLRTEKGKKFCKKYLSRAEKIFVRDVPDYEELKNLGLDNVKLSVDMAFAKKIKGKLNDYSEMNFKLESKKYVVITMCEWFKSENFWEKDRMKFSGEKKKVINAIKRIIKITDLPVVFLPTVYHDYQLGIEMKEILNDTRFIVLSDRYSCSEMSDIVAGCRFLFAMRMHSIIFAIRAGIPFCATIYDQKVESLVRRCGMEKYIIEFDKINTDEFDEKLNLLIKNSFDIRNELLKFRDEMQMLACNTLIELEEYLD